MCEKCKTSNMRPFPEIDPTIVPFPALNEADRAEMGEAIRHYSAIIASTGGVTDFLLGAARISALMGDVHATARLQAAAVIVGHTARRAVAGRTVVELNDAYQAALHYGKLHGASVIRPDGAIVPAEKVTPPQ